MPKNNTKTRHILSNQKTVNFVDVIPWNRLISLEVLNFVWKKESLKLDSNWPFSEKKVAERNQIKFDVKEKGGN